ncbi:MAG TPA: hypothetical protein VLE48_08610 [Terriglobales bacterium]|nr:hypothetical protein [Terriglobales bacterium]
MRFRLILALLVAAALSFGQEAPQPKGTQNSQAAAVPAAPAEDISGAYSFLEDGEYLQLNIQEDKVTGYVSRFNEEPGGPKTFLDQLFDKASLDGDKLKFTTRKVHGIWFEFEGKVTKAANKKRSDEGYFLLRGTLTKFTTDANGKPSGKFRAVEFKSFEPEGEPMTEPTTPSVPKKNQAG